MTVVLAIILVYLIKWITGRVNRSLDGLSNQLTTLSNAITKHCADAAIALQQAQVIAANLQSFRDSEKGCLNNLKSAIELHAKSCDAGQGKVCDISRDIDAIGATLQQLAQDGAVTKEKLREIFSHFLTKGESNNGGQDDSGKS